MTHRKYSGKDFNTQRNSFYDIITQTIEDKYYDSQKILCKNFYDSKIY